MKDTVPATNGNLHESQQPDFKKETVANTTFYFGASIISVLVCYNTYMVIEAINEPIRSKNKEYEWPCLSDFVHLLWELPLTILSKLFIEKIAGYFAFSLISSRYKHADGSPTEEAQIYANKIRSNTFKTVYNLFIVIFGYFVLSQLKYYPKEFFGEGDLKRIFEDKYPDFYFHDKPKYFDFLYMMNLCYYLTDLIWLVWISEPTSDYNLMIIHHVSTILLIFFSFWTNTSNIGSMIFYLHNIGNVVVYMIRVLMYSELSTIIKGAMTVGLIAVWIYTRLFVFGKLILLTWYDLTNWSIVIYFLWPLAVILYILHVYWVYEILKKLQLLIKTNTVEDVSKIKQR
jgi:hypothetical protein